MIETGYQGESKRQRANRRLFALREERQSWVNHYRDLADHFLPRRGRWLTEGDNSNSRGEKRNNKLLDISSRLAARTLSSGMMAGLTSPARPWFRLTTQDPDLAEYAPVKDWLYRTTDRLREIYARSNFYNALPVLYSELGVFGTAPILMDEDDEDVIRCYPFTVGSYYIAQSARGQVDTFYREDVMTVRQVYQKFVRAKADERNLSTRVIDAYRYNRLEEKVRIVHGMEPNTERDPRYVDRLNMPIRSCYWEMDAPEGEDKFLRESGYEEQALLCPRWETSAEDSYGMSPAMDALGGARALQYAKRQKMKAIDKHVDPPMVGHPDMKKHRSSLIPGDVTYAGFTPTGGAPLFQPAYVIKPEIAALLEDIRDERELVRRAMYEDLFLMLAMSDRREITAREIAERHEEKLLMLGPVLERLNDEMLDPAIDRTFAIAMRQGQIPIPPEELDGTELKVEYISILAQAQRMVTTGAIERLVGFAGEMSKVAPEAFDKIDADQAIDEYAEALGAPPTVVRSDEDVAALRAQRQQQQAQAQMAAMAQPAAQASQAVKNLSEAPVGQDSTALDNLLRSVGMA